MSVGCGCPGLAQAIEGADFGGYVDPVVDGAPWVEETAPESADFLGVFGLEEEGGSAGTLERTPVELAGGGSNIGVERFKHRELTYQVVLVARSEAGMSHGLGWLMSARARNSRLNRCSATPSTVGSVFRATRLPRC